MKSGWKCSLIVFPAGARGGRDQFNWENVKSDKDREFYLGHSVKATTGRWQKGTAASELIRITTRLVEQGLVPLMRLSCLSQKTFVPSYVGSKGKMYSLYQRRCIAENPL